MDACDLTSTGTPLLIDGGLSTALEDLGRDFTGPLWTARLINDDPEALIAAHLAYLRAGARCLISASYQASFAGFERAGLSRERAERALRLSVDLAREAIRRFCHDRGSAVRCLVAASVGPYGAFLADGSEYRGDYAATDGELADFHRERLARLDATDADCFAVETIPSIREARIIGELLEDCSKPAWVSFSCRDGAHICDGTPIAACSRMLKDRQRICAIGFNCTAPHHAASLIACLKPEIGAKLIVVYPNSGESYDPVGKRWLATPRTADFTTQAMDWVRAGAGIVGGCCRVGPGHIADLARALAATDTPV